MGRKKSSTTGKNAAEKQSAPLALRLDGLINERNDLNDLKDYLGVSLQAINQYRRGLSRPSLENLCRIADFYEVSADYLLGRTEERTPNQTIQSVCKFTGLPSKTVEFLNIYHDAFTHSFYRKFFDEIIMSTIFELEDVPNDILNAAQARVVADRNSNSGIGKAVIETENKLSIFSDQKSVYEISAEDASAFFLDRAQKNVSNIIEDALGVLFCDAVNAAKALADRETINPEDFKWIIVDESDLEKMEQSSGG